MTGKKNPPKMTDWIVFIAPTCNFVVEL